ncbi:MAG TPA: DNA mismatch repair protein MutS [Verrucomicrobiae bacterium]|jgi:DNA mismatch repair protein MutS|nr:DNA mismatch repair protein MutS [Verrucomicrobiae bacterium]
MLEQYFGMKGRHPEAVLLSRVGDFYEAYGDDAETIARALQIALTSKEAGGGRRVAMAGVPHHALSGYLAKLVAQRFIVALAEQLEAPQPNKLVRRDVVRLVTPGTLIEDHLLDGKQNNYLAALAMVGESFALAYADVSTGYCGATAISGEDAYDELLAELGRVGPSEVVVDLPADVRATMASAIDQLGARIAAPSLALVETRERGSLSGFSMDESLAMHRALDALAAFVKRTGIAGADGRDALNAVDIYRRQAFMALDPGTRKHLELTKAQGQNPRATLLATLDECSTAMGSRMLARWLTAPLMDPVAIGSRQDAVAALLEDHARRDAIGELLRGCFDIERIAQKVRFRRAAPRDLASLRRTLDVMRPLRQIVPPALARLVERIGEFDELLADLQATLVDEPPAQLVDGGVIRPQADAELAQCVALRTDARGKLLELEERERERTGIKGLRVKYASAFGYAIEISKSQAGNVPPDYVRKQTLTTGERYITPELKELEIAIGTAQSRQLRLEERLYAELVERVAARGDELLRTADAVAEIDVLGALARCAAQRGYVRPQIDDGTTTSIRGGRHPVMEAILRTNFVPNDLQLEPDAHRFVLLTGPNMGGKSTYLRQAGLLVVMAQIGSFVPAKAMRLGVVDRIFTRIGAGDDLASGQSTFYMEMAEAANILRRATRRSLLLIDEVGRGTGTIDGLSIAQAICEFLLGLEEEAPMVLFATHFHELCALADHWPLVANYHITAVENTSRAGSPVFSHRVQPGSSSRSFGIEVARMAGLPQAVVERAQEIADVLAGKADLEETVPLRKRLPKTVPAERQLSFLHRES